MKYNLNLLDADGLKTLGAYVNGRGTEGAAIAVLNKICVCKAGLETGETAKQQTVVDPETVETPKKAETKTKKK